MKVTLTRCYHTFSYEGLSKALSSDNIIWPVVYTKTSHRWRTTHRLKGTTMKELIEEIKEESSTLTPDMVVYSRIEFVRNPDALLSFVESEEKRLCRDPFTLWVLCGLRRDDRFGKSFDCVGRNKMKIAEGLVDATLRRLRTEQLI
ncbi:hypothetical protein SPFM1_00024 [Salmonella phage SPFM1]|nr:hypothetical protein SPFM1_00024 [Salmonella phage SPFM1]